MAKKRIRRFRTLTHAERATLAWIKKHGGCGFATVARGTWPVHVEARNAVVRTLQPGEMVVFHCQFFNDTTMLRLVPMRKRKTFSGRVYARAKGLRDLRLMREPTKSVYNYVVQRLLARGYDMAS